ncbi:2,3-bisphosphoglycerate-independent phosphoglycerate mutase [Candidatus Wolfebacteria bacterium]|nr:2,3-bisphosphoglycerate-independent phosphoglycerate mutase [Candidatus Wolfebacteria bacterium]
MSKRTVVLLILDGWGIGKSDESNPIHVVNPENLRAIRLRFPAGSLQASGISVGLPWGEEGNSEVGHLNIGTGQVIYQHYPKITLSVRDKTFFQNPVLKKAFGHARDNQSSVNIVGLLTSGNVHSSLEHLRALLQFAEQEKISKINLHLFTDGRDSSPYSAINLLKEIPRELLASLSGRFYAMDRDNHWERTERVYKVLLGDGEIVEDVEAHVKKTYAKNFNDEYVEPTLTGKAKRPIQSNDAVIFFDFREDRMRQIASPFALPTFNKFAVKKLSNVYLATMTEYEPDFKAEVAFRPEKPQNSLGKILSENQKVQFRIAETQKYPHITYFFNGLVEEPYKNEYRVLIPSRKTPRQDDHPQMMTPEITQRLVESVSEGVFDFVLTNFANPDMIAHTGNYEACLEAVRSVDDALGKIMEVCLQTNSILVVTSDHGNIERVFDPLTGLTETKHDPGPVPFYLIAKEFEKQKTVSEIQREETQTIGILADVAPTILELMNLPKPKEMTGQSLLKALL